MRDEVRARRLHELRRFSPVNLLQFRANLPQQVFRSAQKFVKAIKGHDVDGLTKLISSDHVFVDSLGTRFPASAMRGKWQQYFTMVPDYWIKVDQVLSEGNVVILRGSAGGTFVPKDGTMKLENKWERPRRTE